MIIPLRENYLAHVIELRDAGRQLMRLFEMEGKQCKNPLERHKIRRQFLEAELHVLRLEDVIEKMRPSEGPAFGPPRSQA